MSAPELVLLAAGLSTRFGRPKQLEPVGPGGESLVAYTVVDALRAGFSRVVLVTNPESPELESGLRDHLETVLAPGLPLAWVHQRLDALPAGHAVPAGRTRPWGTAQALLAAAPLLTGPFGVANADDWYGPEALVALAEALPRTGPDEGVLVTWRMADTLSRHGGVSRGVVNVSGNRVTGVTEVLDVRADPRRGGRLVGRTVAGRTLEVAPDARASMNLWGLPAAALEALARDFRRFLEVHGAEVDAEFPLSSALDALVADGRLTLEALPEGRRWFGITFAPDRDVVRARLAALHADGTYPTPLARALPSPDSE